MFHMSAPQRGKKRMASKLQEEIKHGRFACLSLLVICAIAQLRKVVLFPQDCKSLTKHLSSIVRTYHNIDQLLNITVPLEYSHRHSV